MYFNVKFGRSPTWWYEELLYVGVPLCNDLMTATHSGPKLVAKYNTIIKQRIFFRSCDRASWQILIIKPTRCTNFSNLFWNEILHVSDSSSVHHQEFSTVHTAMVHVIQVCWQQAVSRPVWHISLMCVQWKTPDVGQRNCPKYLEFHSENKFE